MEKYIKMPVCINFIDTHIYKKILEQYNDIFLDMTDTLYICSSFLGLLKELKEKNNKNIHLKTSKKVKNILSYSSLNKFFILDE